MHEEVPLTFRHRRELDDGRCDQLADFGAGVLHQERRHISIVAAESKTTREVRHINPERPGDGW